jgi:peptide deformylase
MRHIVTDPDPILLKVAKPVTDFDVDLSNLIEDMIQLMFDFQGVGIAAPQVGESLRVIAFMPLMYEKDYPMPPRVLINPVIYDFSKNYIEDWEGCLSLPGQMVKIFRPLWVDVHAQDEDGNSFEERFEYLSARIVQHEINHLDGVLINKYINNNNLKLIAK